MLINANLYSDAFEAIDEYDETFSPLITQLLEIFRLVSCHWGKKSCVWDYTTTTRHLVGPETVCLAINRC